MSTTQDAFNELTSLQSALTAVDTALDNVHLNGVMSQGELDSLVGLMSGLNAMAQAILAKVNALSAQV